MSEQFVVWSGEFDAWLRPAARGCTRALVEAGVFDETEAAALVHEGGCKIPVECAIGRPRGFRRAPPPPRSCACGARLAPSCSKCPDCWSPAMRARRRAEARRLAQAGVEINPLLDPTLSRAERERRYPAWFRGAGRSGAP
jgi:hypothetical protein